MNAKLLKQNWIYFVILLSIPLILAFLYWNRTAEAFQEENPYDIPKIIWSYWDNPETMPKTVKMCIESWKKYNPDYKVIVLNKSNYRDYVSIPDTVINHPLFNDFPARFADLIRIHLIEQKGGVWCDSSILMGQPLSDWLKGRPNKELYGFTIVYGKIFNRYPILENWFFAAPPNSPFMHKWREEFVDEMMKFSSHNDYVQSRETMGVDLREFGAKTYLAMHVAAQKLFQIDKYPLERLALQPSEEGPFRYTNDNGWNEHKALTAACKDSFYRKPFMKIRGNERGVLENGWDDEFSMAKCKWLD